MTTLFRNSLALAAVLTAASTLTFAQAGGSATYKAKCQMCHGTNGAADTPTAKMMKVKPVSDPEVKKMSAADMIKVTTDGKGRMPSFKGKITDAQIKEVVEYYRSLK